MKLSNMPITVAIALALFLHCMRAPEQILHPQFWAEDGKLFFLQDYLLGPKTILSPYSGYLHLWPRLISFAIGYLPLLWIPLLDKIAALFTHFILLTIIARDRFPATHDQKVMMIFITALVPHGGEVFLNLANSITYAALIMISIVSCQPATTKRGKIIEGIFLFIMAGSGPFILFLAPLFFLFIYGRERNFAQSKTTLFSLAAGFIFQLTHFSLAARGEQHLSSSLGLWASAFRKFFRPLIFANLEFATWFQFVLAIGVFISLVICYKESLAEMRASFREKRFPVSLLWLFCAVGIQSAAIYANRSNPESLDAYVAGPRYFYGPYILILWGLVHSSPKERYFGLRRGLVTVSLLMSVFFFHSRMPYANLNWPKQAADFAQKGRTQIHILPVGWGDFMLDQTESWRSRAVTK